jgi:DNA-binding transcriptional ArsR family regulator
MDIASWLRDAGLTVDQLAAGGLAADATIMVATGSTRAKFAVEEKSRAPYPNELPALDKVKEALSEIGVPLLAVPFVSESLGATLTARGWSWADGQGDFDLRAPGLLFRQRRAVSAPRPTKKTLPAGSGSWGIIRSLLRPATDAERPGATATVLASRAGVSQPRASQVLTQLRERDLVERQLGGRWRPNWNALLDCFLAEYPGPGGSARYCYSLQPPAHAAVLVAAAGGQDAAISADVGPDILRPMRRPAAVIVYSRRLTDISELGLVEAQGEHDANVIIRMPADRSVFPVPGLAARLYDADVQLAEPVQMIWDLNHLGGDDRAEAAEELREWLRTRR